LESSQAVAATRVFREMMSDAEVPPSEYLGDITLNFEYVSPDNLIVVPYAEEKLMALNIITNETGEYAGESEHIGRVHSGIIDDWVDMVYDDNETLHEGYVMVSDCHQHRFKLKTNRYLDAHRAKNDINSTKKLLAIIYSGNIDDLLKCKDLEADPAFYELLITKSENIKDIINNTVSRCENFYADNKDLERKFYAIKSQESDLPMGCLMNLYLEKDPDYLKYFMKNLEQFEEAS